MDRAFSFYRKFPVGPHPYTPTQLFVSPVDDMLSCISKFCISFWACFVASVVIQFENLSPLLTTIFISISCLTFLALFPFFPSIYFFFYIFFTSAMTWISSMIRMRRSTKRSRDRLISIPWRYGKIWREARLFKRDLYPHSLSFFLFISWWRWLRGLI